ncbi:hypothetical protein SDC9_85023 [bioreactor metagenome]|uniref:Uncharacterized protein n=1 Tax=bioreactor metagenome TaxID=1076179 RepID=A0A644ZKV0_9ZZZZ
MAAVSPASPREYGRPRLSMVTVFVGEALEPCVNTESPWSNSISFTPHTHKQRPQYGERAARDYPGGPV